MTMWLLIKRLHQILKKLSEQLERIAALSQELEAKSNLIVYEQKLIDSLENDLNAREARVTELESILESQEEGMQLIKKKLKSALLAFEENQDLTVEVKNGKVYVSMTEQLLFRSGSYEVDEKGQEALKSLALALKDLDVLINVEGHTDDVPIKSKDVVQSNWELSVLRATSIVRILQSNEVPAKNIIASGRAEYQPKAEGKTKEARSINRRTEIIISPKLDELYKMIEEIESAH